MTKAFRAMWLVLTMSVRVSPWQTVVAFFETLASGMQALQPLFMAWFIAGAIEHDTHRMVIAVACFGALIGLVTMLMLIGNTARINQRERVGFAFDSEIARITATIPTLDHLESAKYLDELQALRDQQNSLGNALNMVFNVLRMVLFAGGTIALAATADWRLVLIAVAGLPNLISQRWLIPWQAATEKTAAEPGRLTTHLMDLGTGTEGAAELRVFGIQGAVHSRLREAVGDWRAPWLSLRKRTSAVETGTSLVFYLSVAAVLAWLVHDALAGRVSVDTLVLAVVLIGRLQGVSDQFAWAVRMLTETVRTTNRFVWLRDYAADVWAAHPGTGVAPTRLRSGIRTDNLTYHYVDAEHPSLNGVSLDLPAGSVVALVGENGAGKSTLVKLLTGMYQPTDGRVLVDGTDLASLDLAAWRGRCAGAFQDFARFEFTARESVGVGALAYVKDQVMVERALRDGAAEDVLRALPNGLSSQLGTSWPDGVELSGGQWQRLAIGRGMMREEPLLLVLDEPTAALDAATEHALFERYASAAREARRRGAVTLLVTHRFSTVAAADLVVVLEKGKVVEVGTHAQLIAAGGHYAELYELQARGYR